LAGAWRPVFLAGLIVTTACTKANPAFWVEPGKDAAASDENPPPAPPPDAAVDALAAPDQAEDTASADATGPDDVSLDAPEPLDAHPMPDVSPEAAPDAAADLTPDSRVTSGLVAHWRLDEGGGSAVRDATPAGNSGVTGGGPQWARACFPAATFSNPSCLILDGEDDFVEITGRSIPGTGAPKSLSVWFKATAPAAIPIRTLIALTNEGANAGIQLGLDGGKVAAWMFGDLKPMVASSKTVDGNWHHAVYTYDGSLHRLYYDGALEDSLARPPLAAPVTRTRLGTWKAPEEMFAGIIDDVRIYSRALDPAEVAALAAGQ
jgi:hypothetical protein